MMLKRKNKYSPSVLRLKIISMSLERDFIASKGVFTAQKDKRRPVSSPPSSQHVKIVTLVLKSSR